MNGFKLMSDGYKQLVKKGTLTPEQADPEIRIFDFLADCSTDDLYRLMDSSAFNDILKSYIAAACDEAELSDEQKNSVMNSLKWLLDTKTAREICL